jgi:hypothetical protein
MGGMFLRGWVVSEFARLLERPIGTKRRMRYLNAIFICVVLFGVKCFMNDDNHEVARPQMSISEQLLYSTMKIMSSNGGQITGSTGTGFFFTFDLAGVGRIPAMVTNKHVIANTDGFFVDFHLSNGIEKPNETQRTLVSFEECPLILHPVAETDLCAILLGPLLERSNQTQHPIYYSGVGQSNFPTNWNHFDALEEVLMVGCPNGIIDEVNKLPIFRRGHTATSLVKNYNGKAEFMIDMACFPGSSGSPVFILNEGSYETPNGGGLSIGTRFNFVGVLYAGPYVSNNGTITFANQPNINVNTMMHLGSVIKATELLRIGNVVAAHIARNNENN